MFLVPFPAGAVAVMALERVPADIRKNGGVARMSDPHIIKEIKEAVTIPVMAKARIGHYVEAQILEALDVDYIDESEVRSSKATPPFPHRGALCRLTGVLFRRGCHQLMSILSWLKALIYKSSLAGPNTSR